MDRRETNSAQGSVVQRRISKAGKPDWGSSVGESRLVACLFLFVVFPCQSMGQVETLDAPGSLLGARVCQGWPPGTDDDRPLHATIPAEKRACIHRDSTLFFVHSTTT